MKRVVKLKQWGYSGIIETVGETGATEAVSGSDGI